MCISCHSDYCFEDEVHLPSRQNDPYLMNAKQKVIVIGDIFELQMDIVSDRCDAAGCRIFAIGNVLNRVYIDLILRSDKRFQVHHNEQLITTTVRDSVYIDEVPMTYDHQYHTIKIIFINYELRSFEYDQIIYYHVNSTENIVTKTYHNSSYYGGHFNVYPTFHNVDSWNVPNATIKNIHINSSYFDMIAPSYLLSSDYYYNGIIETDVQHIIDYITIYNESIEISFDIKLPSLISSVYCPGWISGYELCELFRVGYDIYDEKFVLLQIARAGILSLQFDNDEEYQWNFAGSSFEEDVYQNIYILYNKTHRILSINHRSIFIDIGYFDFFYHYKRSIPIYAAGHGANNNEKNVYKGGYIKNLRINTTIQTENILSDICMLPPEEGFGRMLRPTYFYNFTSNECKIFMYTGFGGNENNFGSLEECLNACYVDPKAEITANYSYNTVSKYIFILINETKTWNQAQLYCQSVFGTNLATIVSEEDLQEALLLQSLSHLHSDDDGIWIGLNNIQNIGTGWNWISGIFCDYVGTGSCINDTHWGATKPDNNYFLYSKEFSEVFRVHPYSFDADCAMLIWTDYSVDKGFKGYYDNDRCNAVKFFMCDTINKYVLVLENYDWYDANVFCQIHYNSTLGIIDDTVDILESTDLMKNAGVDWGNKYNQIWMGLYYDTSDMEWSWFDDGKCDIVCIDHWNNDENWVYNATRWDIDHPHYFRQRKEDPFCGTLDLNKYFYDNNCYIKQPFICSVNDYDDRVFKDYCQEIINCWIPKEQSFVKNIIRYPESDWIENYFSSNFGFPIAFWNNYLFVFTGHTSQNIWYSNINDKFENIIKDETGWQFVWDYIEEPVLNDISGMATLLRCVGQQWVQHNNIMYTISDRTRSGKLMVDPTSDRTINVGTGPASIIDVYAIDLNMDTHTTQTERYELPQPLAFNNSYEVCITTNGSHIFIVSHSIWIYNINNNAYNDTTSVWTETGHVLFNSLVNVGCTINNNHTKLYIFGGLIQNKKKINDKIFIYYILNDELQTLSDVLWANPRYNSRAIMAPNDNIYLYGGWSQYETETHPIFDTVHNQFLNDKYSEQYNHEYFYQNYITPSAVFVKDNMLLRMDSWINKLADDSKLKIQLQYLITNRVSINFAPLQRSILPSNDRSIKIFDTNDFPIYLFNEFMESNISPNYTFLFYSDSLDEEIRKILIINREYCLICNYNQTIIDKYKYYDDDECVNCRFGLNLPESQLIDVGIYEIKINIDIIDNGGINDLLLVTNELKFDLIIPCLVDFSLLDNISIAAGNKINIKSNFQFKKCENMKNDTISSFSFHSSELLLDSNVTFIGTICDKICDNNNGQCYNCLLDGLFLSLTTSLEKRIFDIKISPLNDNTLSIPSAISIKINDCESGTGIVSNSSFYECKRCQINQFKLNKGFSDCYTCINKIDGVQCLGSNVIKLTYNYWINGYNTKTNKYIDIEEMSNKNGDILYSHFCAPLYCCHELDGCLYNKQSTNLCADNRLITSPLCSKCVDGTNELFGTTACGICDNYNFLWLFIMFILSMIFVFYIFFIDSININLNPYKETEINWKKLFIAYEMKLIIIMIFKIILYYYQSLAQIAALTGINHFLLPLVSIFDLSLDFNNSSSSSNGICVIPHLNALNEILMSLIFIIFILFHCIWICIAIKIYKHNDRNNNDKHIAEQ